MNDCIFCAIVAGQSAVSPFYEDELVLGFMDLNPVTTGHALVIPKAHATYLADMPEATGRQLFTVAQRTAAAMRQSGVPCDGVNLFVADGEAAGQEVFHVHLHVIPRFAEDGFKISAEWSYNHPRHALDATAAHIAQAYQRLWATK